MIETFLIVLFAFVLDKYFGELPNNIHPLVGFGNLTQFIERTLHREQSTQQKIRGIVAVLLAIVPLLLVFMWLGSFFNKNIFATIFISSVIVYIAIGWQSLIAHGQAVAAPLANNDLVSAREAVSLIVSRDTSQLDTESTAKAAVESMLENGADAIFAPLFWFVVAGVPGVVLHRLSNTLDAMWGYKNSRYQAFGWAAARLDDVLNYIPARLTALSYASLGQFKTAMHAWKTQAPLCDSPNAGPVMAAGAGVLGVSLGGDAMYAGEIHKRPLLGVAVEQGGKCADSGAIYAACQLVSKSVYMWVAVLALLALIEGII